MNKIQYIKLLELRGVTKLSGETIASAVRDTGGDPTTSEMIEVNHLGMIHYLDKYTASQTELRQLEEKYSKLLVENEELQVQSDWLGFLEAAGVDNWSGYGIAQEMREDWEKENE